MAAADAQEPSTISGQCGCSSSPQRVSVVSPGIGEMGKEAGTDGSQKVLF